MSRRTLYIILFVSLAVNLFAIGLGAGAFFFGERLRPHRPPPEFRGGGPPMMAAAAALPDNSREAYRDAISAEALAVRPKLKEARQLRHDAWMKLAGDPVDADTVAADLDRARALESEARAAIDRRIVDFTARLPAAERGPFAQALSTPPQRRGRGGHGEGGPDGGPPMPVPPRQP